MPQKNEETPTNNGKITIFLASIRISGSER